MCAVHSFKVYSSLGISTELCLHPMASFITQKSPSPFSGSWQPLTCFPFLWMCLLWAFHVNGITHSVALCLASVIEHLFSRFIHVVASVSASVLFEADE